MSTLYALLGFRGGGKAGSGAPACGQPWREETSLTTLSDEGLRALVSASPCGLLLLLTPCIHLVSAVTV